jgi:hypothetical protein
MNIMKDKFSGLSTRSVKVLAASGLGCERKKLRSIADNGVLRRFRNCGNGTLRELRIWCGASVAGKYTKEDVKKHIERHERELIKWRMRLVDF